MRIFKLRIPYLHYVDGFQRIIQSNNVKNCKTEQEISGSVDVGPSRITDMADEVGPDNITHSA